MGKRDLRIDEYIAKAAPFAHPILKQMRDMVHQAVPEAEETIKWGMPHFMVGGKNLAGMSAFKAHCGFAVHGAKKAGDGYGQYDRITSLGDLPEQAVLTKALHDARDRIVQTGSATAPRREALRKRVAMAVPDDFAAALSAEGQSHFDGLAPSHRREYLEWIVSAKRPETRARRIASAVGQLAEGRKLNWKYES